MNIYLISNESYHLINDEIKNIVKDKKYLVFNMNKCSVSDLINEANYYSLMEDDKILVVSNADFFSSDKIKDEENELLLKYLNAPNEKTTIIFTTQKVIDSRKKTVKLIKEKYKLIYTPKMDKKTIISLIQKYAKQNDFVIDYEVCNYLINNSYDSIDIILNDLDKLFLYYGFPSRIKLEDVSKVIGEELESNNFHFVAAVIDKDLKKAVKIYQDLKIYKVEPISLLVILTREYRLMFYIKILMENGLNLNEMCQKLHLQDWQVNKLYNNSLKYSKNELLKNICDLTNTDISIKKGLWDKDLSIYSFLMDACN